LNTASLLRILRAMKDVIFPGEMQRTRGAARVALVPRPSLWQPGGWTLGDLYQQGSAKVILPEVSGAPEVVFLNTSGGLTGGDRLSYALHLGPGLRATATTQTAERAYKATAGTAEVALEFDLGAGTHLDWLPQETILFDQARLTRRTVIRLQPDALGCLALESVVLGRAAMGETVGQLAFSDRREVWRGDRLIFADPVRLTSTALGGDPAGLGGARAFASLVLVAPGAEDALVALRPILQEPGVRAAASALPGRLTMRALAVDGWPLRRLLTRVLTQLRRQPLPRVWQI
jgi:urease accessory protein